jgi:hypothetical protein
MSGVGSLDHSGQEERCDQVETHEDRGLAEYKGREGPAPKTEMISQKSLVHGRTGSELDGNCPHPSITRVIHE